MITYPELIKLFGTPVSKIPVPYQPFKFTKAHYFFAAVILGLAAYGTISLIKNKTTLMPIKIKDKEEK